MDSLEEKDWWWIDYLENELDPQLEKKLEILLECSVSDREAFDKFSTLRRWVGGSDPARGESIEKSAKRVRRKVMAEISEGVHDTPLSHKPLMKFRNTSDGLD